jgi:hypothetical protein
VADLARQLFVAHDRQSNPPRLDLAVDASKLLVTYLRQDVQNREAVLAALPPDGRDAAEAELEERRRYLSRVESDLKDREPRLERNTIQYLNEAGGKVSALERAAVARRLGLVREAIAELRKEHEQFQKQLGDGTGQLNLPAADLARAFAVHAELIELLWYDGKVEEAARILDTVDTPDVLRVMDAQAVREEYYRVRQQALGLLFRGKGAPNSPYDADPAGHFRNLRRALATIVGDFDRAADVQKEETQQIRQALTEFQTQTYPKGVPTVTNPPDPQELRRDLYAKPVQAPIAFARLRELERLGRLRSLSGGLGEGQLAIALTYLEQGDVPRSVGHFQEAARDAAGWPEPIRAQKLARDLLKAIERAGPPGKRP